MGIVRIAAIALIAFGILGLVYGGFSYNNVHRERLGSISWTVNSRQTVYVPVGVGVAAIVAGAALLLLNKRS